MPELEQVEKETRSKRRAIIDAAREMFAKQGYEETTIAQIAAAAGVAVGTVYLYFRNKREIYTCISLDWVESIAEVLLDPDILDVPIEQVSRAVIETSFRLCHDNSEWMSLFQVDLQSREEIEKHKAADGLITRAIATFFHSAIEQGKLAPFDTEMYAEIIFSMVHGVLYNCFCVESGEREEHYRESTIDFLNRLFFGPPLQTGTAHITT